MSILESNPDYIVPVAKKGCKILRSKELIKVDLGDKIKYKLFFENHDVNLKNKKIAVIDDATKYTSNLYAYRKFFESQGAEVNTYSFVGQEYLQLALREKYDEDATVFQYLDEATYQEYILQQSATLIRSEHFYDIDHIVAKLQMNSEKVSLLLDRISSIGEVEFTNDFDTPENIQKFCFFNFTSCAANSFFNEAVCASSLNKIRFTYDKTNDILYLAPIAFPVWDTSKTDVKDLFKKIPFMLPYSMENREISQEAVYFNIAYVYHVILLYEFLAFVKDIISTEELMFEETDMACYIGATQTKQLYVSLKDFLSENKALEKDSKKRHIVIPFKSDKKFLSVLEMMDELRDEYEKQVASKHTILGQDYYLSYDEIYSRYSGYARIEKWIDILCDRGVLVTRSFCENGIYFRGFRSGEANYEQRETRTAYLIAIIINLIGEQRENGFYYVNATYLNKLLSNLYLDFDCKDWITIYTKPYQFGPMVYAKMELDNEKATTLYNIREITALNRKTFERSLCDFKPETKEFFSYDLDKLPFEPIQYFSEESAISYSTISDYILLLRTLRDEAGKDEILNAMAICRNEDFYYRHVYYNIKSAFEIINKFFNRRYLYEHEEYLRNAERQLDSTKTKLSFSQESILDYIEKVPSRARIQHLVSYKKIKKAFTPFSEEFKENSLRRLKECAILEHIAICVGHWCRTYADKYYNSIVKAVEYYKMHFGNGLDSDKFLRYFVLDSEAQKCNYLEEIKMIILDLLRMKFNELDKPEDDDFTIAAKARNKMICKNTLKVKLEKINNKNSFVLVRYKFLAEENEGGGEIDLLQELQKYIFEICKKNHVLFEQITKCKDFRDYGLVLFKDIDNALDFIGMVVKQEETLNKEKDIAIRLAFGCYVGIKSQECEQLAKDALIDAEACCLIVSNEGGVVISENSYLLLGEEQRKKFKKSTQELSSNPEKQFYEYIPFLRDEERIFETENLTDEKIKIGIITVLTEEYDAMKKQLYNTYTKVFKVQRGAGHTFLVGEIKARGGKTHEVVLSKCNTGNNSSADKAALLLSHFPNLEVIIMSGIAGGTPMMKFEGLTMAKIREKHVRLGDIVVSDSIFQYDEVSLSRGNTVNRDTPVRSSAVLQEAYDRLKEDEFNGKKIWEQYIDQTIKSNPQYSRPDDSTDILHDTEGNRIEHPNDPQRCGKPYIFKGKIGSGNVLLRNPTIRDTLKEKYGVLAVEMESAGIADVVWRAERSCFVVRGITDYCDDFKGDIWHNYAALCAAAYTRSLIECILEI